MVDNSKLNETVYLVRKIADLQEELSQANRVIAQLMEGKVAELKESGVEVDDGGGAAFPCPSAPELDVQCDGMGDGEEVGILQFDEYDTNKCHGLVWSTVIRKNGKFFAAQCRRKKTGLGDFCKNHGPRVSVSKHCDDCSSFQGCDVVHEFKYEHLGTIFKPNRELYTSESKALIKYATKEGTIQEW